MKDWIWNFVTPVFHNNKVYDLSDFSSVSQVKFCDVILCNRYYAWYHDYGQTQLISKQLERELRDWFDNYGKPVIQAEYGADTVAGMHVVRG